ncbi:MAG: hypothetical protein V4561_07640 [Bacteroidota bacterium]
MLKSLYLVLFMVFTFSACNLNNPKEQIPTYLHLEPFIFNNPDSNFTGSTTYEIPSAWVYVDDIAVGTFDLPCTAPVIMSKTSKVKIVPAVVNQGIKSYVIQYPFYQSDTTTIVYNPGKIQNYTPKTSYSKDLTSNTFKLKVNFEEGLLFKNLSGDTTILLEKDPSKARSGSGCGAIYLKSPQKWTESITSNYFESTQNACYLEFDYKGTLPFQIGLQGENSEGEIYGEYIAGFYPKDNWGKIYIDISPFMKANKTYSKIYLKVRSTLEEFDGKYTDGYVLLDNIKVISR